MDTPPAVGIYDAVTLIDVYEHVPPAERQAINLVLGKALAPDGVLIVTVPSPLHQEHLRRHRPEGLQIVDETIGVEEIAALSREVGGTVTRYEFISVWHTNDYVHAVIERKPKYRRLPGAGKSRSRALGRRLMARASSTIMRRTSVEKARRDHVRRALGIEIGR